MAVVASLPLFAVCSWLVYLVFFSRDITLLPFAIIIVAEALFWRSAEVIIIVNNGLNRFGISAGLVIFGTVTRAVAAVLFTWMATVHDVAHWAFVRYATFNAFWYKFFCTCFRVLEITVCRTCCTRHCTQ